MWACKKGKGFSLAEILLTIAIVGIVASVTIPNLISASQRMEAETAASTAYSHMGNALYSSIREYQISSVHSLCASGDNECFKDFMRTKLDFAQDCGDNIRGCWFTYNYMDGSRAQISGSAAMLKNGMCVLFEWLSSDCSSGNDKCGRISVDTNGPKGPNQYGYDTFIFHVWPNTIVPYGASGDKGNDASCSKDDSGLHAGYGCTAQYVTKKR